MRTMQQLFHLVQK